MIENPSASADTPAETVWLTLQEASARLGVSTSTVRRWADSGRIPARRTSGGHRRFDPQAVHTFARDAALSPPAPVPALWQAQHSPANAPAWYTHLGHSPATDQMRELGQRLLGLLIQYLAWPGEDTRFLADGRAVGARYGAITQTTGVTLSETVQAFLHFRTTFWRMALQIPPVTQATDAQEIIRIAERIEHFMDEVLLGTICGYEQAAVQILGSSVGESPGWTGDD